MVNLITATQCLNQLHAEGVVEFKMPHFSGLVSKGKVPSHHKPGKPKKYFLYEEVKQALEEIKDPRRDPQREANKKKRDRSSLLDAAGSYPSVADMSDDEKRQALAKQEQLRALREEAEKVGAATDHDEDIDKMGLKELNKAILQQDLRLKTVKANEAEAKVLTVEYVEEQLFTAGRLIRDGLLGIPARLSARLAAEQDPHVCRTMLETEIITQLNNLTEVLNEQ